MEAQITTQMIMIDYLMVKGFSDQLIPNPYAKIISKKELIHQIEIDYEQAKQKKLDIELEYEATIDYLKSINDEQFEELKDNVLALSEK